jgi:D-alanyl-D-alanine carboxypeptidase
MRNWLVPAVDYVSTWIEFQQRHHGLPGISIAVAHDETLLLDAA